MSAIGTTSASSHNAALALLVSAISVRTGCGCAIAQLTRAQSALSQFKQEHRVTLRAVCAVQFFDGAQQVAANRNMNAPEIRARVVSREKKALTAKKAGFMRFDRKIRPSKKRRHAAQSDDELFRPYLAVPHLLIKKLHRYFRDLSNSYRACCYCLMNVDGPLFPVPLELS